MPNMPTPETITAQHPNHYSIQESVACEKCNPYDLTDKQYRAILDQGGDPSTEHMEDKMQEYSNPKRASNPYSLPNIEVCELTAEEAVQQDEDLMWRASNQFPLMHRNSRDRDKAIAWAIEESGTTGGWFWWSCFPGCLPDGPAIGPFKTYKEALADAREGMQES